MVKTGELEKVGPGRYKLAAKRRATEHHDLVVATGPALSGLPGFGSPFS